MTTTTLKRQFITDKEGTPITVILPVEEQLYILLRDQVTFHGSINWRKFGVKMFGTGWDMMGLYEQNGGFVIDTKVLFYM